MWMNFCCTARPYVSTQPCQSAVLFCSSLLWCAVVYRLHLCGPDNAVSLIILCQKTVLIMGHYPHWPRLLLTSLSVSLNHCLCNKKRAILNDKLTNVAGNISTKYKTKWLFFHSLISTVFMMLNTVIHIILALFSHRARRGLTDLAFALYSFQWTQFKA